MPAQEDPEALRRRLYRPGAGADDVDAYRATAAAVSGRGPRGRAETVTPAGAGAVTPAAAGAPPEAAGMAPPLASVRPVRRRPVGLLIPAAVLAVIAVVAVLLAVRPAPTPTTEAPVALPTTAEERAEFVADLRRGGAAGIAAYLVTHASPGPLRGLTDPVTREVHGSGTATVRVDPAGAAPGAGRVAVLVVTATGSPVTWTALRLGTDGSPVVRLLPLASRGGDQAAGALTAAVFRTADGQRPVRLRVEVPAGVRWGAAIVYSG